MKDLTNKKIHKWTFLERRGSNSSGNSLWLAKCECGEEKVVTASEIRIGRSRGCRKCKDIHEDYGIASHHRLYSTWTSMRNRCNNKGNKDYRLYGDRGIKVCKRWDNFFNFLEDMLETFEEGKTLDRKDNYKGYTPENCRWATAQEQVDNRRPKEEWV